MGSHYTGRCACGGLSYKATAAPVAELHCQCRHCQMRSGTGHSSYLVFAGDDVVQVDGRASTWEIAGDSGAMKSHAFCPTCGTPVYVTFPATPGLTAIHAGSLDQPVTFKPQFITYADRAHSWDRMDPSLTAFARMPPR